MSAQEDFDLSAAGLRADGSDLRISIEVLASKLEASLPSQTAVQRHGGGLLGRGEKHVRRIEVRFGEVSYVLNVSGTDVEGSREKRVGRHLDQARTARSRSMGECASRGSPRAGSAKRTGACRPRKAARLR